MESNRATYITIAVILLIIGIAAFVTWGGVETKGSSDTGPQDTFAHVVDTLTLTNLDGEAVNLKDYEGSVVVLNTWASWCPFCIEELPDFARLASEYSDQNVVVLAVNRAEDPTVVGAYLATLTNLEGIVFLLDQDDAYYKFVGGFSMPETLFYHADGTVSFHKRGFMALEEMRSHVEAALKPAE